jgi:hypothetical protein
MPMKMTVITGKDGTIVGTAREGDANKPEAGIGGPLAGPDQSIHVIDLPKQLENVADASELHRGIKTYVAGQQKK